MEETIEKKVTDAILQRASVTLEIEGREYPISPASPATIILVSELVATMPAVDSQADNILFEVLRTAKDTAVIGKIAATLILGAKRIREQKTIMAERVVPFKRFSFKKMRLVNSFKVEKFEVNELEYLADLILLNCSNVALREVVETRLTNMEIGSFFGLTTSLSAANQIKRTREVVETAFGD